VREEVRSVIVVTQTKPQTVGKPRNQEISFGRWLKLEDAVNWLIA
jgi:hypothetical protein